MSSFVSELDDALIDFVKTDDMAKLREYCRLHNIALPQDPNAVAGGVYKAVQYISTIPQEIKTEAARKCIDLDMLPIIEPFNAGGTAQ